MEWLLTQTIRAGQKSGAIDERSTKRVAVDTTVMEKSIAHPTDSRLYERARDHLVALAQEAGVELRQSYARLAPRLALQVGRYEFGCKASVTTALDEGFVVGMRSFPGNPYDGHTLRPALEQVEILTDQRPDLAVVDRGYRGHDETRPRPDQRHPPRADAQTDHRPATPQLH